MNSKGKIYIEKPYIERVLLNGCIRLCARCHIDDFIDDIVWYEVDNCYEQYLCYERGDAFVVNFLLYAMENGLDIVSEAPISERLFYQLTMYWVPSVSKWISNYNSISIIAPKDNSLLGDGTGVGTAMSGGVDSFYTVYKHLNIDLPSFRLTHLTFFNAGASGEYGGEKARRIYKDRVKWISSVTEKLGLPLITMDTNVNEILMEVHMYTVTVRTLAMVIALQKLFRVYYFSSSHALVEFKFSYKDTEYYDLLNMKCFSTENVRFYGSGGEALRLDKERFISQFELPQNKLNVCISEATNCSRCDKCKRTMLGLYTIGKLELYKKVFDVEYFYKNKELILRELQGKKTASGWWECYEPLREEWEALSEKAIKKLYIDRFSELLEHQRVVLRGGGMHTKELVRLFPRNRQIVCIWDKDEDIESDAWGGYKVVRSIEDVRAYEVDTIVVSTYTYREEVKEELKNYSNEYNIVDIYDKLGIELNKPFYFYDFR